MRTYARIKDGVVREVKEFPSIKGRFHPSLVWVEVPEGVEVREGYLYDGRVFSAPPPPEVDPEEEAKKLARQQRLDRLKAAKAADLSGIPLYVAAILKDILDELNLD